mgnify:CR=1 FL=1
MKDGWERVNKILDTYGVVITTSVMCMVAFVVICTSAFVKIQRNREEDIAQLQQRIEQLESRAHYYDEIMVTYQFFNEHWTETMKGE